MRLALTKVVGLFSKPRRKLQEQGKPVSQGTGFFVNAAGDA
jgi:hypothetical protein